MKGCCHTRTWRGAYSCLFVFYNVQNPERMRLKCQYGSAVPHSLNRSPGLQGCYWTSASYRRAPIGVEHAFCLTPTDEDSHSAPIVVLCFTIMCMCVGVCVCVCVCVSVWLVWLTALLRMRVVSAIRRSLSSILWSFRFWVRSNVHQRCQEVLPAVLLATQPMGDHGCHLHQPQPDRKARWCLHVWVHAKSSKGFFPSQGFIPQGGRIQGCVCEILVPNLCDVFKDLRRHTLGCAFARL